MTIDFRASQIQTNKIITDGSTGTSAKLLVYPLAAEDSPANQGVIDTNIFDTSNIGTDVFVYFSGSIGTRQTPNSHGVAVFGGEVVISGSLKIGDCDFLVFSSSVTEKIWLDFSSELKTTASVAITTDENYTSYYGSDVYFYVSGTGDKKSVFGNNVVFSGNVINFGNYGDVEKKSLTTDNDTPTLFLQYVIAPEEMQSIDLLILGKQTDNLKIGRWRRELVVYDNGTSVAMPTDNFAVVPDFKTDPLWGINVLLISNTVNVYVTGSSSNSVFWEARSTSVSI